MEIITSLDNDYIKNINKLHDKKYRDANNLFLVESEHLIDAAYDASMLKEIIALPSYTTSKNVKITYVSEAVMKKLSNMVSISKCLGVVRKFEPNHYGKRLLLLDDIQDPGNLGTIIRSAVAFNIDTIILGLGCVDLYNDKVIRSSEGMLFNIDIIRTDLISLVKELKENEYAIYATSVVNGKHLNDIDLNDKYGIIIGNEGNGVNDKLLNITDDNIYIPINKKCESLNAAVAASIIMYEISKVDYE